MNFFKPKFWDKNQISLLSALLFPVSLLTNFLGIIKCYLTKSHKSSIPTICVGNIYLGGTGKTPLCIEIFSILKNLNLNPGFIRKQYDLFQDETNLQKKVGPVFQNKKRINALKDAINNNINIAVMDDGFQDCSINYNLSIVCFNEKQWIGNGLTIPSGPLREGLFALNKADCVFINGKVNKNIEAKILSKNSKIKIFYFNYKAENINQFKNKKIVAFAGIGNPENFFDLLKDNGLNLIEKIKFPDHHKFTNNELENLLSKIGSNITLLTTEKDYLRLSEDFQKKIKYLKINVEITNKDKFVEEIKKII